MNRSPKNPATPRSERRIIAATTVGTMIEVYDFAVYATAAALVFGQLFFPPAQPGVGLMLAFATVGISFLFRPLGAIVAGHLGDRYGRRVVLVVSLLLMGGATTAIGVLPTYGEVGAAAPVLLVTLRVVQGFSIGGEWAGAALMAVEHAPPRRRGFFGAFPQIGTPLGILLSNGVIAALSALLTPEQFLAWGWRLPFLFSVVLLVAGVLIRLGIDESPVFEELRERRGRRAHPLATLARSHGGPLLITTLLVTGCSVAGYVSTGGYVLSYATSVRGLDRTEVLSTVLVASAVWVGTTLLGGHLSDRFGRRRVLQAGFAFTLVWAFPLLLAVRSGGVLTIGAALVVLAVGLGLTTGPQSSALAEAFPASVRFSGAAIAFAAGSILGGAFAPMIATWLQMTTGSVLAVAGYLAAASLVGLAAAGIMRDRTATPLGEGDRKVDQDRLAAPDAALDEV